MRDAAGAVLWNATIQLKPLISCESAIEALRFIGREAQTHGAWDRRAETIPEEIMASLRRHLGEAETNQWIEFEQTKRGGSGNLSD